MCSAGEVQPGEEMLCMRGKIDSVGLAVGWFSSPLQRVLEQCHGDKASKPRARKQMWNGNSRTALSGTVVNGRRGTRKTGVCANFADGVFTVGASVPGKTDLEASAHRCVFVHQSRCDLASFIWWTTSGE